MKNWGITAKLLLVPILSVALLVTALGFIVYTQGRYDTVARLGVSRQVAEARLYTGVLNRALKLHSQYLDLATARLAGGIGPKESKGLNALLGATLDLNSEVDDLGRDRGTRDPIALQVQSASQALTDFQELLARLSLDRSAQDIRADVVVSNAQFAQLTAALTSMIASAQSRGDESFTDLESYVRRSFATLAVVLLCVGALALAMTVWARRAVARPLGAVAAAMRRFRVDPNAPLPVIAASRDEVGQIVAGFQDLAASVHERERALEDSSRQLRDSNDALHSEVRDRRAAEAKLLQSREFLQVAQSAGGIGVFDLNLDSGMMQGSEQFFTLQGLDPRIGAISQDQWLTLVHPDDLERLASAFAAAVASGGAYRCEYRIQRLDRSVRWVSSAGRVIDDAGAGSHRIVGSVMDINERMHAELALRETEARLARAVHGTSDGLFEFDVVTEQLWFAPRVAQLLGYAPADFPQTVRDFHALIHPDDVHLPVEATLAHLNHGVPHDIEFRVRDADGEWQWVRSRAQANRDATTGAMIMSGSLQLVTDRRQQAAELERARTSAELASRAKSEFLANMSHEIRTPINGVIGMTHVLLDSPLSESQRECAEIIRSSGESLLALVNDILDFSKIEAGKMELERIDLDARTVIDDALGSVALAALGKDLELAADVAADVPARLRGDPGRLRQCLINLLSNAIKFTAQGHVTVEVARLSDDGGGALLKFTVSDSGIGIPPDRLDRLFREFSQVDSSTTRHYGGSGLGLSIVRRLAGLMGGEAGVESEVGVGSRFWFTGRFEVGAADDGAVAPPARAKVVVLEGQPVAARNLGRELQALGCEVDVLADDVALAAALSAPAPPDIVMLDVRLLNGPVSDALAAARAAARPPRIVLLAPLGLAAAPPAGFDAMLSKPVRRQQLGACVRRLLDAGSEPTNPTAAPAPVAATRRILLVEDNAVNRRVAEHQLRKLGCTVTAAENGAEGVVAAAGTDWDLILMDCQMPVLDGFEATRQIRQREAAGRHVPIVALTAHALAGDREACLAAGMDDYLTKPLEPAALAACIERWVPRTAADAPPPAPPPAATTAAAESSPTAASEPASDEAPAVDLEALHALTDGDADFERELMTVFVASGDAALAALIEALGAGDLPEVRRHAHALKGASSNLRAKPLAARAQALEAAATAGDADACRATLTGLEDDYRRTTAFIAARTA